MYLSRAFPVIGLALMAMISVTRAEAQEQVFHKGDRVLVTPYGGEWEYCTLIGDRIGNPPANFSYSAECDPWPRTPGERPPKQTHLFSAERVKALNDPVALAGVARMQAMFPTANGGADPEADTQPAQGAAPPGPPPAPAAAPQPPDAQPPAQPNAAPPPAPPPASAQAPLPQASTGGNFKSVGECTPGRRVTNNMGETGTVLRVTQGTMCMVHLDQGGDSDGNKSSMFWMLRPAGTSRETSDRLTPGAYECFAGLPNVYADMDITITGPGSYRSANENGTFHMGPSNQIVYDSGALKGYTSKLLAGPSIGLNQDGGTFFGTHCDLKR